MSTEIDNAPPTKRRKTSDKLEIKIGVKSFWIDKKLIMKLSYFENRIIDDKEPFELKNIDPTYFQLILDYLKTKQILLTDQNVESLYETVTDLLYEKLLNYIHTYMLNNISQKNLQIYLRIAEKHDLSKLTKKCDDFMILNPFLAISKEMKVFAMSQEEFEELLGHHIHHNSDDVSIMKGLIELTIEWVNHDMHNRSNKLVRLFQIIPLKHIPADYLYETVFGNNILKNNIETLHELIKALRDKPEFKPEVEPITGTSGERLYVIGGRNGDTLATMSMLDASGQWVESTSMLTPRSNFGCAVVGKFIYICGGFDGTRELNDLHVFDTVHQKWSKLPPMQHPRESCAMAALDGRLYVAGGNDANGANSRAVERFSVSRNRWETIASMKKAICGLELIEMGGYLYAIGGKTGGKKFLRSVQRYDPEADEWTILSKQMKKGLAFFGAVIRDSRIYAADQRDFQVMDLDGKWLTMPRPASCKGGVRLANFNGRLLAIGGRKSLKEGWTGLSRVQRFCFETSTWQADNDMDVARCHHCVAVVRD